MHPGCFKYQISNVPADATLNHGYRNPSIASSHCPSREGKYTPLNSCRTKIMEFIHATSEPHPTPLPYFLSPSTTKSFSSKPLHSGVSLTFFHISLCSLFAAFAYGVSGVL